LWVVLRVRVVTLPEATERLSYRPLDAADAEALHEVWGDPEVVRHLPSGPSATLEETAERVTRHAAWFEERGYGLCAVVEQESGRVVGVCGLFPVAWKGPDIEVAYHFARAVWNRGYATEAAGAWLETAFADRGLDRVVALAFPANRASTRVMEKIGMQYESKVDLYGETLVRYAAERS
jgi:[ribosomal protein S5]-alanine N-acetyltransferase